MLMDVSMTPFMWGRRQGSVREVTGLHHPSPSAASYGPDLCGTAIKTGHRSIEQYSNCLFIFFFLSEFCFNVPSFIRTDWFTLKKLQYLFPTISFFFFLNLSLAWYVLKLTFKSPFQSSTLIKLVSDPRGSNSQCGDFKRKWEGPSLPVPTMWWAVCVFYLIYSQIDIMWCYLYSTHSTGQQTLLPGKQK